MKPRRHRTPRAVQPPVAGLGAVQKSTSVNESSLLVSNGLLRPRIPTDGWDSSAEADMALLERARSLWLLGDWAALAGLRIGNAAKEQHSLHTGLSLLVAMAHYQLGRTDLANQIIEQVGVGDCSPPMTARALLSGAYNSLGRAQLVRGHTHRAAASFTTALGVGFPGSDHRAMVQARMEEQSAQLGISTAERRRINDAPMPPDALIPRQSLVREAFLKSLDGLLATEWKGSGLGTTENDAVERHLLKQAATCLTEGASSVELVLDRVQTASGSLALIHVRDDYIPGKILREGRFYELEFLQALAYFHRPDGLVIDVGANIGNHTLYLASVLGARVAAFEPQPHNIVCLELNVRLNGVHENTTIHRCALGSAPGTVLLSMTIDQNYGSFSATPTSNPNGRPEDGAAGISVPVCVLDEVLATHHEGEWVSVLKIDVEGMELEVLGGAEHTLRHWQPIVACECFDRAEFSRIESFLTPLGYCPVAMLNHTPTFLFYCRDNAFHVHRVAQYMRKEALFAAGTRKGFLRG